MNGATALDCEKTISSPKSTKTMTIGINQYFFSCRRNCQNSASTRLLAIGSSVHPGEVISVAIAGRIRRPPRPVAPPQRQGVTTSEPPDQTERCQDDGKGDRQDDAGVDVAQHHRELPPRGAWILEQPRRCQPENQQHGADRRHDLCRQQSPAPHERGGNQQQDHADRDTERSFLEIRSLFLLHRVITRETTGAVVKGPVAPPQSPPRAWGA